MKDAETTAFGVAPPHAELGRLEPLVGAWEAEDQHWTASSARGFRSEAARRSIGSTAATSSCGATRRP
jgi:hypothetical protein